MGQLEGRVAVVTGSGRGIGQQIALRLARDGARIVVNDAGYTWDSVIQKMTDEKWYAIVEAPERLGRGT